MTRTELIAAIGSPETIVVCYKTQRSFENFLLNRALEDDSARWHEIGNAPDKKTIVLVVQTCDEDYSRQGQII